MDEDRILMHPWLRKLSDYGILEVSLEGFSKLNSTDFFFLCWLVHRRSKNGRKLFSETYFITIRTNNKIQDNQPLI